MDEVCEEEETSIISELPQMKLANAVQAAATGKLVKAKVAQLTQVKVQHQLLQQLKRQQKVQQKFEHQMRQYRQQGRRQAISQTF